MKNPIKVSFILISISIVLFLILGILFTCYIYYDSIYVPSGELFDGFGLLQYLYYICLIFPVAWLSMFIGMIIHFAVARKTIVRKHTIIGIFMWVIFLPLIIVMNVKFNDVEPVVSSYQLFYNYKICFFVILLLLWMNLSILLPIYHKKGKIPFFIILISYFICMGGILINSESKFNFYAIAGVSFLSLIILIISYWQFLKWATRKETSVKFLPVANEESVFAEVIED